MGMHYSHFLLPADPNLAPTPTQVVSFLRALNDLSALPLRATVELLKHCGESRTGFNPMTGETLHSSVRARFPIVNLASISEAIVSDPDYDLVLTGEGPEPLRPFPIYETGKLTPWVGPYYLQLSCSLRPATTLVQALDPQPTDPAFHRLGRSKLFAPSPTRPRFWIAFELGKWLHPQARGQVLIAPEILQAASTAFATDFTEGWTFN